MYNGLAHVGFEGGYYESHFSTLILGYMGFDNRDDKLFEFYVKLIDKYSGKIEPNNDSIMKYTMKVYVELAIEKKKRSAKSETISLLHPLFKSVY